MAKETANSGFIKLYRSLKDWQHYGEPTIMAVFTELLLSVNYEDGWWQGLECERGATFISIRTMADDLKMSVNTIQRALKVLTKTGEIQRIKIFKNNTKTIINNFSKFQGCVSNFDTLTDTLTDTKQEYKERKEDKERDIKTRTHEEILQEWLNNRITLERFCMTEHLTIDQFTQLAQAVINEWAMTGESGTTESDTRKKMLAHIRRKAQAMHGYLVGASDEDKRLQPLIDDCKALVDAGYNRPMVQKFYKCYTQKSNDGSGRMLFETLGAWDTEFKFKEFLKREEKTTT